MKDNSWWTIVMAVVLALLLGTALALTSAPKAPPPQLSDEFIFWRYLEGLGFTCAVEGEQYYIVPACAFVDRDGSLNIIACSTAWGRRVDAADAQECTRLAREEQRLYWDDGLIRRR